jgi:hypothetical protein
MIQALLAALGASGGAGAMGGATGSMMGGSSLLGSLLEGGSAMVSNIFKGGAPAMPQEAGASPTGNNAPNVPVPEMPNLQEQGPALPATEQFGPTFAESNLLKPDAGFGDIMARVLQKKRQQDEWAGNPLNRLANKFTLGIVRGPGGFTGEELYGTSQGLSSIQKNNMELANQLLQGF